ncbi:hypothetical protein, partial [Domibacillus robiginosus]|uniref:hypothetical protein n=1 Tax=Domibacillus robiginosus TaxID=1071054 RepID=UPI001C1169BD
MEGLNCLFFESEKEIWGDWAKRFLPYTFAISRQPKPSFLVCSDCKQNRTAKIKRGKGKRVEIFQ